LRIFRFPSGVKTLAASTFGLGEKFSSALAWRNRQICIGDRMRKAGRNDLFARPVIFAAANAFDFLNAFARARQPSIDLHTGNAEAGGQFFR